MRKNQQCMCRSGTQLHDLCDSPTRGRRRRRQACRAIVRRHEFAIDLAESIIIDQASPRWTRVQTSTGVARYFRISLFADVYYLFAASNPFDIPRRRINKSADHRGPVSCEDANINNFLCRMRRRLISFADIIRMNGSRLSGGVYARSSQSWSYITKTTLFPFQLASLVPRAIVIMPGRVNYVRLLPVGP